MNDQRFDWPPSLQAPFIEALVNTMFPCADPPKSGQNVTKTHDERQTLATQVISALYQAYSSPYTANTISYPKKSDRYGAGHYEKLDYSYRRAVEVFNKLQEFDWIVVTPAVIGQKYTRIEATGYLAEVFDDVGLVWFPQRPLSRYRTVLLRDVKRYVSGKPIRTGKHKKTIKEWKSVEQTDDVLRMQNNLYEINSFLSKQCITLDLNDDQLKQVAIEVRKKKQDEQSDLTNDSYDESDAIVDYMEDVEADSLVDLRRVQLVRIFARGSMDKGGRFYRGWWQGIPSMYRPHIVINGKKTVEVDFSSMHLNMLYAELSIKFPEDPNYDAYDLGLNNWNGKSDPRRKIIKVAVNALLNDEDQVYSLNKEMQDSLGLTNEEFHLALKKAHPKIYGLITSDIGLKLQKKDSDIAERVLLWFTGEGIPCLPIHDSFIVPAGYVHYLKTVSKAVYEEIIGTNINAEAEVVKDREHFGIPSQILDDIPINEQIKNTKDIRPFDIFEDKNSIMEQYLSSYEVFCFKRSTHQK
jgi:hypothetical protein